MTNQKFSISIATPTTTVHRNIDVEWKSDINLEQLSDENVFLLSEALRSSLIHDNGVLYDMVKELISHVRKSVDK